MKTPVYNGPLGKLIRTLGFLLVLAASLVITIKIVLNPDNADLILISSLTEYAEMGQEYIADIDLLNETTYIFLALSAGLLLIVWAIGKSFFLRILVTVLVLATFIFGAASSQSYLLPMELITPDWLQSILANLEDLMNEVLAVSQYVVPAVALATAIFLWAVFANKKPSRISIFLPRMATTTLFLAILLSFVATEILPSLMDIEIVAIIKVLLYLVTYAIFALASVFGVLGFARQ
jgi:hypothetical protein